MSIIVSKIELLDYIRKQKVVTPFELVGVFGYTESAARQKLAYISALWTSLLNTRIVVYSLTQN